MINQFMKMFDREDAERMGFCYRSLWEGKGEQIMYKEHSIGVVIPSYNEENHIKDTIETLPDFVDKIYVIDDGSTDKTSEIVKTLTDQRIRFTTKCLRIDSYKIRASL